MIRKMVLTGLACLLYLHAVEAQSVFSWPVLEEQNKPWTRWWWMGNAVDSSGITDNLTSVKEAGMGGVEITPVYGVKGFEKQFIDFLSPEWMKWYDFAKAQAGGLGLGVDVNNGTGWPFGGPQIDTPRAASKAIFQSYTLKRGERLQKPIVVDDPQQENVAVLQTLMAYSDGGEVIDLTKKVGDDNRLNWKAPKGRWTLIAVFLGKTLQDVMRAAPGGEGLVMDHFSGPALQKYLQRFSGAFSKGKYPPPHNFFCDSYEAFDADWTENIFQDFMQNRGYRLEHHLPALLKKGNADSAMRVIADYRQTISDDLLNYFARPWTQWVRSMNSISRYQAHGSPGNLLDLYGAADILEMESFGSAYFNIPGLTQDSLYPDSRRAILDPLLLKFSSSAAHVMGRALASSETFTWLGEHFRVSLAACKPVLDQILLSGINRVYFHGTPYSPKGAPWPGWQFYASINVTPYNPIWHDILSFNTYIGRVQSFLQDGQPDNDVLLYWPVQDVWATDTSSLLLPVGIDNTSVWLDGTDFHRIGTQLLKAGYGFDYISDLQLEKTLADHGELQTPGARYRALVIPPCRFIPEKTLSRILKLANAGAKIICLDHLPTDVPGLNDLEARRKSFYQQRQLISAETSFTGNKLQKKENGLFYLGNDVDTLMRMAGIEPEGFTQAGLKYVRRKAEDHYVYFVSNLDSVDVRRWIPLAKDISSAVLYDASSGEIGKANTRKTGGRSEIYLQLRPGQSLLIKGYTREDIAGPAWHYTEYTGHAVAVKGPWSLALAAQPRGLAADAPAVERNYTMDRLVSWTTLNNYTRVYTGTVKYMVSFDLPDIRPDEWLLSLGEVDHSAEVKVNGQKAGTAWHVPFDLRIGKYLKPGKNTLEVDVTNLGANLISEYDRTGVYWKRFYNINMVNMQYTPFDAAQWRTVPAGLLGPVKITPMKYIIP